jgi:hypothetical protein
MVTPILPPELPPNSLGQVGTSRDSRSATPLLEPRKYSSNGTRRDESVLLTEHYDTGDRRSVVRRHHLAAFGRARIPRQWRAILTSLTMD